MKILKTIFVAMLVAVGSANFATAGEYTSGEVKKVDMKNKKVTIKHDEIKNLEMPGMTMVFRTSHDKMLEEMKAGDNIEFVVDRVKGKLTIMEIKK